MKNMKKALCLFLALVMCLGMLPVSVFAAETPKHEHNQDGWVCKYTEPVTEQDCKHTHDETCGYVEAKDEVPCDCGAEPDKETGEVTHTEDCAFTPAVEGKECGHVCDDACVKTVTEGYYTCTAPVVGEETPDEGKDNGVPAEVKTFLTAVAELPAVEDIDAENAEEIGAQVNAALDMADALREDYYARDDVTEALNTVYAVYEAVLAAEDIDEGGTFDASGVTNSVFGYHYKDGYNSNDFTYTGDYQYYAVTARGNVTIDSEDGAYDSGVPMLDPPYNATPGLAPVSDSYNQPIINYSTQWSTSGSAYGSSDIATASVSWSGTKLTVNFTPGTKSGTVYVYIHVGLKWRDEGNFMDPGFDMPGNLYICYKVTNNVGSTTVTPSEKPDAPNKSNTSSNIKVVVQCQDNGDTINHTAPALLFYDGETTITPGEVVENPGNLFSKTAYPYQCEVELNGAFYVKKWNTALKEKLGEHYLVEAPKKITFYYDAANEGWVCPTSALTKYPTGTNSYGQVTGYDYGWLVKIKKATTTTYKVVREYYIDGTMVASSTVHNQSGTVGQEIVGATLNANNPDWVNKTVDGKPLVFEYKGCTPNPKLVLTSTAANNVITLRYERETVPTAPTKDKAAEILDGKYTVKVICTNEQRTHTLASKVYSITAADITGITATPYKNAQDKWEVEVTSTKQQFVDKFEAEANVNCAHDDVSGGFGVKLVWDGSKWTYNETFTREVETACHPAAETQRTFTLVYHDKLGSDTDTTAVINMPAQAPTETPKNPVVSTNTSETLTISSTVPQREGYTFVAWQWGGAGAQYNPGGEITLTANPESQTAVKADLYAIWEKNPVNPDPEWTVNWMKGYGAEGDLPWETIPDTVPVKTETIRSASTPTVPQADYPTNSEMQAKRDDSKFIGWGTPDVDEDNRVITITAKWETTESTNTQFYKVFNGGDDLASKISDDFEVKITITDLVTNKVLATGTLNKGNNLDQRIYFDYVVEHGYKVTIVESNYEIEGYTFKSEATREEITAAAPTPVYSQGMVSGSSGTHGIDNTYAKNEPKIVVTKTNDSLKGFKIDPETGNAVVTYTVTVTNESGYSLYGLKLTDVMQQPTLTRKDGAEGTPSVKLTFGNWQVQKTVDGKFEGNDPYEGDATDLNHVLALLDRNEEFRDGQKVTLKYTVEIEPNGVPMTIKLDNEATAGYWKAPKTKSAPQNEPVATFKLLAREVNDPFGGETPDGEVSAGSSTGGDSSTPGGSSGSHTEGELPAKYTVTYEWNLPKNADPAKTLPTDDRPNGRPAGAHFTVDDKNKAGDKVTVNGETWTFSGWTVPEDIETETKEGEYKGQYVMPERNVVITGTWTKTSVPTTPITPSGKVIYLVQWLDKDGNKLKDDEIRGPEAIGNKVAVDDGDKVVEGYTFDTENASNVLQGTLSATEPVILKLYFNKQYAVTYTWSGLPEGTTDPAVPEAKSYAKDAEVTLDTRAKDSEITVGGKTYVFSGWTVPNGVTVTDGKFTMPEANVAITGTWTEKVVDPTPEQITATWLPGHGGNTPIKSQKYPKGTTTVPTGDYPANPTRSGYTFDGWGTPVVDANGDITITAQWRTSGGGTDVPDNPPPTDPGPGTDIPDENPPLANVDDKLNTTDHFAYVIGYPDGSVRPTANITRAEAVTIFFRLLTDEYRSANWSTENSYSDVEASAWYNNAISTATKAGIFKGDTEGTARPDDPITRAEFAALAARFISDSVTDDGTGDFADTVGHWAAKEIRLAAKAGWITGVGGGKFEPDRYINRAEVMTLVNRMLDRIPDKDHMLDDMIAWPDNLKSEWYYEAVQEATNGHDYERLEGSLTEKWTQMQPVRDWEALEKEWSTAESGK